MVVAGTVTVKVELDASDVPSSLAKTVSTKLKPALNKAESEVDRSVSAIRSSLGNIDSGVSGSNISAKLAPDLKRAEQAVDQSVSAIRDKLSSIGTGIGSAAGAAGSAGAEAASGFVSGFGGAIAVLGTKAGPVGVALAATAGIGLLAGKVLADSILDGMGQLQDQANVAAKMGLTAEQMKPLGAAASSAYAAGFGESVESNLDAVRAAVQGGLLDPDASAADTQRIVEQLNTVSTVTGEDIPRAVRTAQQAIRTGLATDVTGAFDLITKAQQNGLNVSEDLFDTINEYGTQFRKIGFDGADAFGLIQQAVKGGARDTDTAADAIKEFSIRAVDGSKTSTAAYENLGLSAKATTDAFAQGGQTARDMFQQVVDRIAAVQDPARKSAIQVALFGTKAEDLGNAINNMNLSTAKQEFGDVAGAAQKASDTMSETAAAKWEQAKRTIETAANSVRMALADVAGPAMQKLGDWVIANREGITNFFIGLAKAAIDAGTFIVRSMGDVISVLGQLGQALGDIQGGVLKFQAWQADIRGDDETARELRRQAEEAFGFGEGLTAMGESMKAVDGEGLKRQLDEAAAGATNAATETDEFGNTVAALPVDGVTVPITADTTEANAAMDSLFDQYRKLSVGVEIGDAAAAGVLGGAIVGLGDSYGLPAGTSTGGYGGPGQDKFPQWVRDLGEQFGVQPSTYPGHQEASGKNQGIDWVGSVDAMDRFAKALAAAAPEGLNQVIWQNPETGERTGLTPDGRVVKTGGDYYRDDWAGHQNHVHTAFSEAVAIAADNLPPMRSANDPQAGANLPVTTPPNLPAPTAATPGLPGPVDPGAAPVPITVAPVEVDIVELFSDPTDDPVLNDLLAKKDARENAQRQADANKAATAAAQNIADAKAAEEQARIDREAVYNSTELKSDADRAKADADYNKAKKAVTTAESDYAELLEGFATDAINDQIDARQQSTDAEKARQEAAKKSREPFDYTTLPLGDPRRVAAQGFMGAGGTAEEFDALMRGRPEAAAAAAVAPVISAAAAPLGQAAGDAAAAAVSTNLLPTGTPTAPDTDTAKLLAEGNPAALAKLAGFDVADYSRQGGDPGEVQANEGPGFDASGKLMGDTAAMIDRTLTSMEAANKARQDQLLSILQQIATKVGVEVLSPIVSASTTAALTGIAAEVGTALGETAGPIIGQDTAAAVDEKVAEQSSSSGTTAIPGMAGGGGIYGGTPGKDSVPAMLMPGEYVLTTADVARMGGFAGVESVLGGLRSSGGMRFYASGGGVGRASTGNPNGGQNVNSTVGADFFGLSQIPVLALAINALTQVLLKVIDVEIMQRDALIEVTSEFRDFRGDFQAFDAAGRLKSDSSGLTDRTSSSKKQAADERIRILKMVIDGIVKYAIEKIIVPLGKAIGNAIVSALAGAAGGAIAGGGGSIAGGIASAAISAAGAVAIDIAAEIFTIAAETLITIGLDVIGEFLQTLFPQLTTSLLGGAVLEQIAGPVSAVMTSAIGIVTSLTTNLLGSLGGVFANFIPTFQSLLAGFVPLTASLAAIVGVLSSVAAVLQQILTALLGLGAGIGSSIVSAVTSALSGFMPLLSNLNLATLNLGTIAQLLAGLVPNLGGVVSSIAPAGAALDTALGGITALVGGLAAIVAPNATVNPIAAAANTTANNVGELVTAITSGAVGTTTTVNAPITVISAVTGTPDRIARRLLALTS